MGTDRSNGDRIESGESSVRIDDWRASRRQEIDHLTFSATLFFLLLLFVRHLVHFRRSARPSTHTHTHTHTKKRVKVDLLSLCGSIFVCVCVLLQSISFVFGGFCFQNLVSDWFDGMPPIREGANESAAFICMRKGKGRAHLHTERPTICQSIAKEDDRYLRIRSAPSSPSRCVCKSEAHLHTVPLWRRRRRRSSAAAPPLAAVLNGDESHAWKKKTKNEINE